MGRPRHVFETYIKASPEEVWEALINPEFTKKYFFHTALNCGWEPTPGGTDSPYTYDSEDGSAAIEGVITEAVAPTRLVMSFRMMFSPELAAEPPSEVTWELTPVGDVCRLTCIHGDLAMSPLTWSSTASGWNVVLQSLKTLVETGEEIGDIHDDGKSPSSPQRPADIEWHRALGIDANNATYELLAQSLRSEQDNLRMIHQAHAAAHHWGIAGTVEQWARAEYLCSRVYSFAHRAEPALFQATQCKRYVSEGSLNDFDLAFAHEALARALACSGEPEAARAERALARAVPIADPEDKAIVSSDIDSGPWFGI